VVVVPKNISLHNFKIINETQAYGLRSLALIGPISDQLS